MKRGLKEAENDLEYAIRELVTTYSPMKRGLKAVKKHGIGRGRHGYNLFPDEKGTERSSRIGSREARTLVTTYSPMKRGLKGDGRGVIHGFTNKVTTYSPMKRGLKDAWSTPNRAIPASLQPIPR